MLELVRILENTFGAIRNHSESKGQIDFDCPRCAIDKGMPDGDGRGNLTINYNKGIFRCWSCGARNNMHGTINYLIFKYSSVYDKNRFKSLNISFDFSGKDIVIEEHVDLKLPKSYVSFKNVTNKNDQLYKKAYRYVSERGLSDEILREYNIGYVSDGEFANRILIPSYDENDSLNYFVARSFDRYLNPKYKNPEIRKESIIFNEKLINWDGVIYIVEGVFDHIVVPNSIPMLGKYMSDKLYISLMTRAKNDVIIGLDGGEVEKIDSVKLFRQLNTLDLNDRVKVIYTPDGWDFSSINEKYGPIKIHNILRTATKYTPEDWEII